MEKLLELNVLLILLKGVKITDYYEEDGKKHLLSYWGDEYDLITMQERANELLREFLQPYVINSDSKE